MNSYRDHPEAIGALVQEDRVHRDLYLSDELCAREQERVFAPEYGVHLARSGEQLQGLLAQAIVEPAAPPLLDTHLGAAGRIADLLQAMALRAE